MIARKFISMLALTFLFLFLPSLVKAQSNGTQSIGYASRCLTIKEFYKPSCPREPCVDFPAGEQKPDPSRPDHTLKVEGEGFPTDTDIYIVGCVTTNNNFICTGETGNSQLNEKIRRLGFEVSDNPMVGGALYEFKSVRNPVRTSNGKVSVIVRSHTAHVETHLFFGVYGLQKEKIPRKKTVQFGKLVFSQDPNQCVNVSWDPMGRVFDAVSLEPLPDVKVSILDEFGKKLPSAPGFSPEKTTGLDGLFSFYVKEGRFRLSFEKPGYTFPVDMSEIDPNYSKVYGCDPEVGVDLYNDQYVIEEKGKFIRCDVPLKPVGAPYYGELAIFDYGNVRLTSRIVRYTARFSHPFAIGILKGEKSGKIIAKSKVDKNGHWQADVPQEKIPQDEDLVLEGKKVSPSAFVAFRSYLLDLFEGVKGFFQKVVHSTFAQNTLYRKKIKFSPILPYIEGYAYDEKESPLPNAKVRIVSSSTGNVLLEVKADENGFFKVPPEFLPRFSYYIQIKPEVGRKIYSYTTSQFVRKNNSYLSKEKIDLMEIKKRGEPITFSKKELQEFREKFLVKATPSPSQLKPSSVKASGEKTVASNPAKKFVWSIVAMLIILMTATGAAIYYFIKTRSRGF